MEEQEKYIKENTKKFIIKVQEDKRKRKPYKKKSEKWQTIAWWEYEFNGERYGYKLSMDFEECFNTKEEKIDRENTIIGLLIDQAYRTLLHLENQKNDKNN